MHCEPPAITFIPCEEHFRPVLPTIEGNVDYLTLRGQLTTIDELLRTSGVENEFVVRSLEHWIKTLSQSKGEQIEPNWLPKTSVALYLIVDCAPRESTI